MSLVADYGSDSEDSASESEYTIENKQVEDEIVIKTEVKQEPYIKLELKDEEESSEDDNDDQETEDKKLPLPVFKLPTPSFHTDASGEASGSVFVNPFLVAENEKEAILEKHVKMINNKNIGVINGKKICWNYRKGRCRFGHNCKYAHDSDLQKSQEQLKSELDIARAHSVVCQSGGLNPSNTPHKSSSLVEQVNITQDANSEEIEVNKKKRKRPGLTRGLVPGKKVMKQYLSNKS